MEPLVEIKNLSIRFPEGNSTFEAVKGISFSIGKGEIVGVVGESGSGKSMSALALMGLLPKDAEIASGSLCFQGEDLVTMKPEKRRQLCGSKMAMVFQEPMTSLNPVLKIERQVGESLRIHTKLGNAEIHERVVQALSEVGLPDPEGLCGKYPHELSGGMRQRVMIAQAMINSPSLLIADEPTTALDCVVQAQILELLRNIHRTKGTSILFISHDLNVVRALCSRVIVVYKGEIVEEGQTEDVLLHPKHEYTRHLVASIPEGEKGESSGGEILRLTDLNVFYDVRGGLFRKKGKKHVIHDLNLSAREGEIVGIVGESGCGKSTLSKTILGLHDNYTGEVKVRDGVRPQMVFQDPAGSLNPARTIGWILEEPLRLRGIRDRSVHEVQLVTSDAHKGLVGAIEEVFQGASWQRCAVHLMRDCMREAGSRSLKKRVGRIMSPVFRAKDAATARAMYHVACDMLRECCPKAADVAEEAEPDALAYLAFPPSHWKRLRTNNVQERANREIKRRSRVVQVFPSEKSLERLVGAVMCELDEQWSESRYFAYAKIQELYDERRAPEAAAEKSASELAEAARKMIIASIELAEKVEAA